ncbi:MAG: hypothetical protein IKX40_09655 [Thermoguttaceae bacterium]|nr:hypothetical protein [Thermoguttaceae bacterium]
MRPYNTYRNPELSQPVSSVENTLSDRTSNSNAPFDILRSLSESISVDCGSFEISEPTEYYQNSSAPSHVSFVDPRGREIQTPVESAPVAPVNREPAIRESNTAQNTNMSSVNAVADMDDDNYDCMNDPNYRAQSQNEASAPSFEELMARTAEGLARMREETDRAYSNSENNGTSKSQDRTESVENVSKSKEKPSTDAQSKSTPKKRFLSGINWGKTRTTLFSRETIKLVFLTVAISALIVSAVIYKQSPRRNNGLPESEDVVINQSDSEIPDVPVQKNAVAANNDEFNDPANDNYWNPSNDNWASSDEPNPRALTDQMRGDYQSPTFDADSGYEYNQTVSNDFSNPEDVGRQLASPHSSNQFAETMPTYNVEPKYADVSPAFGSQYTPSEYESPVLEDDTVSGYSETGYNSNFMR